MDIDPAYECLDVGVFTNNIDAMRNFYLERIGVTPQGEGPPGGKVHLYRYLLNGTLFKILHATEPLRPRDPAGFTALTIAV